MRAAGAAELAQRVAAGDPDAFAQFYEQWFDATFVLARGMSRRDEAFCLDVVQEVMLRVTDKLPPLAHDAAVGAWMSRAVTTAVLDRLRGERRRAAREQRASVGKVEAAPAADADLLAREQHGWLAAQLAALLPADRRLIEARFGSAIAVADAGRELGLTADAAHGRLRRCLQRLRRAAEEWCDGR